MEYFQLTEPIQDGATLEDIHDSVRGLSPQKWRRWCAGIATTEAEAAREKLDPTDAWINQQAISTHIDNYGYQPTPGQFGKAKL